MLKGSGLGAYRGGFGSQWLPAGFPGSFVITLPTLLPGLFILILQIATYILSLVARLIVNSGKITNQTLGAYIEVGVGVEIEERALVGAKIVAIVVKATWRGAEAPGRSMARGAARLTLQRWHIVLMFRRRVVGRKSGEQEILLIGGEVKTLLVKVIVVGHDDTRGIKMAGQC